jgi:hypothetical protein
MLHQELGLGKIGSYLVRFCMSGIKGVLGYVKIF